MTGGESIASTSSSPVARRSMPVKSRTPSPKTTGATAIENSSTTPAWGFFGPETSVTVEHTLAHDVDPGALDVDRVAAQLGLVTVRLTPPSPVTAEAASGGLVA